MKECDLCGCDDKPLIYFNPFCSLCEECEEFERNFDIDKYEEDRRRRISEENEY